MEHASQQRLRFRVLPVAGWRGNDHQVNGTNRIGHSGQPAIDRLWEHLRTNVVVPQFSDEMLSRSFHPPPFQTGRSRRSGSARPPRSVSRTSTARLPSPTEISSTVLASKGFDKLAQRPVLTATTEQGQSRPLRFASAARPIFAYWCLTLGPGGLGRR